MNSSETLTCNLFHLPQDIFRVIFQFLSVEDLMKGEEAFLNNQELLSLYRSSLAGFALKEIITIDDKEEKELISWIIDRKLLVEKLVLRDLRNRVMDLLNQFRLSLKTINTSCIYSYLDKSVSVIPPLGHFPSLTSVTFFNSDNFTKDQLLSFFSQSPQLEMVKIEGMTHLSNEILPHISNSCPKIKILSLNWNDWVNNETISLLTQQRLFPNLKSLDIRQTGVTNQESLRQFILSRPLLSGLYLPRHIEYSNEFLVFYLKQLLFPSILSIQNNNNDLETRSLAVSSLLYCIRGSIFDGNHDVVNPEIFSVDILSHLSCKDCSFDNLRKSTEAFYLLSMFPSMIDSILQSQFIQFSLDSMISSDSFPTYYFVNLLFRCGVFHDYFPLLVEKYRTHTSSLIQIFYRAIQRNFSLLTTEELQTMIPIVLNKLQYKDSASNCLVIISKLLQKPSSQLLVDANTLLLSFKSIDFSFFNCNNKMIDCLMNFISVNENYQQLLIESNLLPQIIALVDTDSLINFTNHCLLLSSGDGLLVDHLVDSGVFQHLLSNHSQGDTNHIESLFKLLIEFKKKKYSEMVREMDIPNELRSKLF